MIKTKKYPPDTKEVNEQKIATFFSLDLIEASLSSLLVDAEDHLADMRSILGKLKESTSIATPINTPFKYSREMVKELLKDHEWIIGQLKKNRNFCSQKEEDRETADLLTGIIEQHEATAATLRKFF
jgi:hypothetical protein